MRLFWRGLLVSGSAMVGVLLVPNLASASSCHAVCNNPDGGFTGHRTDGTPGSGSGGGQPATPNPPGGPASTTVTQTKYVPTCAGNTPDTTTMCPGALTGCPQPEQFRNWRYDRQTDRATGAVLVDWHRVTPPAFVCLGPHDPGVDPRAAVIATVRSEFKDFPLERAVVQVRPAGETLVHAPTELRTSADGHDHLTRTILGLPVTVTATASSWTWHFGDGSSETTGTPGTLLHEYRRPGAAVVSLDVTYTGTFTVGGDPTVYEAQGTATAVGPGTPVQVREARSQLQDG